jgi:hypothetical protein
MTSHNPIVSFGIMLACAAAVAAALSWQAIIGFVLGVFVTLAAAAIAGADLD